jgi:hypothetical protein
VDESPDRPVDPARVAALVELLAQRYPGRFRPEDLEQLREQVAQIEAASARLRGFALTNADEPDPTFRAVRQD